MGTVQYEGDLGRALERVAAEDAAALYVPRLRDAAGSLRDLVALLDWLEAAGAALVSGDPALDTRNAAGRAAAGLLREVDHWTREPGERRRPRGRPGLGAADPLLAERIARLRQDGLSLQAIADRLNDAGIPTPRGGAAWRPSSVQAALGYRRPRPPAPGAPPPPRRRPGPPRPPRRHP